VLIIQKNAFGPTGGAGRIHNQSRGRLRHPDIREGLLRSGHNIPEQDPAFQRQRIFSQKDNGFQGRESGFYGGQRNVRFRKN